MHIITEYIDLSEPCYGAWEGHELAPIPGAPNGATGWRWLRKTFVVRDDTIAKHITDFGPSDDYELITPIFLPNEGTDSVGRIWAFLDKNREDTYWQTRAQEQLADSTLISDLIEQEAKIHELIRNRTSLGPAVNVQRNGFAREENQRRFKERRQQKTGRIVFLT